MQPPLRPPASLRGAPGQRLMAFEAQVTAGQDTPPPSQHNTTAKQIGRGNPFSIVAMPSPAIASSAPTPQCCVAAYTAWFTWFIIYFHFNGAMPSPAITSDASQCMHAAPDSITLHTLHCTGGKQNLIRMFSHQSSTHLVPCQVRPSRAGLPSV
eukprot:scaffold142725_cov20-Tisochrysis_lutea.AAC.1